MELVKNLIVPCESITTQPYSHFFGYYDKSPWDSTGRYILAHRAKFEGRAVNYDDEVEIGLIDLKKDKEFCPIGQSQAWNWQQGAMTQWVPCASDRLVIYNSREDDHAVSVLFDIHTQEHRALPMPIYALSSNGHHALTIDFDWLGQARGGYGNATKEASNSFDPTNKGIYKMNLSTGDHRLILSYEDIMKFMYHPAMKNGTHWIDHLFVAPGSANRFALYHRFTLSNGGMYTRILTSDFEGANLHLMVSGVASHPVWLDESHFLVWARRSNLANEVRLRSVINRLPLNWLMKWLHTKRRGWIRQGVIGDNMLLFTDQKDEVRFFASNQIREDGHPSLSPTSSWLIIDTYPDDEQYRHLYLYNYEDNRRIDLGSFYSPPHLGQGWRCDLHPRWNRDGTIVCIDSGHSGSRQMYLLDVSSLTCGEIP